MKVAVTGVQGFLGWHTRCALKARGDYLVPLDEADVVLHLAGVNRAEPALLRARNLSLAHELTRALDSMSRRPHVVFANSIHSGNGTPFGDGKEAAAEHLVSWGYRSGSAVSDVRLPNLFGEHGRPHYNSVVATFSHELARHGRPLIEDDREIPLLHVQDAVDDLLGVSQGRASGVVRPRGRPTRVSALLALLEQFHDVYAGGDIPDLTDPFHLALFNTYRSYCFPDHFPLRPTVRADNRGHLFECLRGHGGQAQVFCSTSHPGITRGEHFHRRKVERFMVLNGTGLITLRRLFYDDIIQFEVSGDRPSIVDMPTMWAHAITNTGPGELMTLFWASELLDPNQPDTYRESVRELTSAAGGPWLND